MKAKIEEIEEIKNEEPLTAEELLGNALRDLITDTEPDELVTEFIQDFVLIERSETPQILALFEMPTETVLQMFETVCQQSYEAQQEAIKNNGTAFIEKLKAELKRQLQELAESSN